MAGEQFCATVLQLRFEVSGITHRKTKIWLQHLKEREPKPQWAV